MIAPDPPGPACYRDTCGRPGNEGRQAVASHQFPPVLSALARVWRDDECCAARELVRCSSGRDLSRAPSAFLPRSPPSRPPSLTLPWRRRHRLPARTTAPEDDAPAPLAQPSPVAFLFSSLNASAAPARAPPSPASRTQRPARPASTTMPPSAQTPAKSRSTLNPNWPQYACSLTILVAVLAAVIRYVAIGPSLPSPRPSWRSHRVGRRRSEQPRPTLTPVLLVRLASPHRLG